VFGGSTKETRARVDAGGFGGNDALGLCCSMRGDSDPSAESISIDEAGLAGVIVA
jgi:hypothetical protein